VGRKFCGIISTWATIGYQRRISGIKTPNNDPEVGIAVAAKNSYPARTANPPSIVLGARGCVRNVTKSTTMAAAGDGSMLLPALAALPVGLITPTQNQDGQGIGYVLAANVPIVQH